MRALLALFVRALRQTTRAPSTYLLRGFIALALLFCLWVTHEEMQWAGAAGRAFFGILICGNYVLLTLVGLGTFSSAIAEEKEEGCMSLLRMTNLSPLGMLLGKSTSRLWIVFLLLATQVPFAFLAVTMGGVSQTQIFVGYGLLTSYLFLFANIALFFSVIAARSSRAALFTIGFAALVSAAFGGPALLAEWLTFRRGWAPNDPTIQSLRDATTWLFSVHPAVHMGYLAEGQFLSLNVARSVTVHLVTGVAFFLFSLLAFERFCGNEAAYASKGGKRARRLHWLRSPGRAWRGGVAWKDYQFLFGGKLGALLRLMLYVTAILCFARLDDWSWKHNLRETLSDLAASIGLITLCAELAFGSLRIWGPEAWGLQLGSLITTPQSLPRITIHKVQALMLSLIPAVLVFSSTYVFGNHRAIRNTMDILRGISAYDDWNTLGLTHGIAVIPATLMGCAEIALPLMLIVNLSLRMKWTALPTALGVYLLVQIGFSMLLDAISFRASGRFDSTPLCKLALFVVLLFFLLRNTSTLLLRRATEG